MNNLKIFFSYFTDVNLNINMLSFLKLYVPNCPLKNSPTQKLSPLISKDILGNLYYNSILFIKIILIN